ncbi:MAG: Ppx/GppA family phosphatase [Ectothiorhodospiraceae bacterium]|nr:Ppx/GppA family phosphatase [Ectothiorhodospiraceae bacterium]
MDAAPSSAVSNGRRLVAAVDLGSNSFHMVVGRDQHGSLQVLDRIKEMVRLAGGLTPDDNLQAATRDRALGCLRRFGQRLRDIPPDCVRAVGTNTLRQLRDGGTFLAAAEQALGHTIEVVSGFEEARLVYLGAAHAIPEDGCRRLVVDIGGGSTELIVGERTSPFMLESLSMGCVSMTRRFLPDGLINRSALRAVEDAVLVELQPVRKAYRDAGWQQVIGTSGTIRAVQAVLEGEGWSPQGVTWEGLQRLRDALLRAGCPERLRLRGLSAERRPVFAAGSMVLYGVFRALGIQRMTIADGALREGLLYDLLGRMTDQDTRDVTVTALQTRYHVDQVQAERVARSADTLLRQISGVWGLGEAERRVLRWAALLHEIGLDIAHSQYAKHGAYVVGHADMAGFSRQDQAATACLIRCHRGRIRDKRFTGFPQGVAIRLRRLAVLLRLAVILHRGRHAEPDPPIGLQADGARLILRLPASWLQAHPLTLAELREEAGSLQAVGVDLVTEAA